MYNIYNMYICIYASCFLNFSYVFSNILGPVCCGQGTTEVPSTRAASTLPVTLTVVVTSWSPMEPKKCHGNT